MSKKNNATEEKIIDANFEEVDDTETNNEVPVDDASGEQKETSKEEKKDEQPKEGFLKKAWKVTKKVAPYVGGAALGAAAMYFFGKKSGDVVVDVPFKEIPIPDVVNKTVETVTDSIPKIADSVQTELKLEEIPETK